MFNVNDYIKSILKKKNWTLQKFADEINKVKKDANLDGTVTKQNISNFLNKVDDKHILRPKQLLIWEVALNIPYRTLINMVEPIKTNEGKKELEILRKRVMR